MATLVFSLSTKVDKVSGLSEILMRFFVGSRINQRAKSNIFVNADHWDQQKQCIVLQTGRFKTIEQKRLAKDLQEKSALLSNLRLFIFNAFNYAGAGETTLPTDWLKSVVNDFYNEPSQPTPAPEPQPVPKQPKPKKVAAPTPAPAPVAPEAPEPSASFFSVFADFIAKNDISDNRKRHYLVVYRALQRYEAYNKITITFDNLSAETLKDFERYLENEYQLKKDRKLERVFRIYPESREIHQRSGNYVKDMMGKLRTFCRYASGKVKEMPVNEPFFKSNPFDSYSIGTQTPLGTPYFLTIDERNHLYHFKLNSQRLSTQRDIFIFQCLIGCRVGDLMRLTWDNVIGDNLQYIPAKTCKNNPKTIIIPMHPIALEIIKRYKTPGRKMLLPFVAQSQYNEDIKSMLTLAGITRKVVVVDPKTGREVARNINDIASSHMARRTFVGNLYNKVKDPNLIGSLSGHVEGSKAFARYRAIDMNVKKELVSLLDNDERRSL